eukprot:CAMPEP_0201565904 /NCGR_PEP_ID=MMETSP0190_2-20130828/5329_1 /ASSEMBLY_ACC=CAM_ASM_000263 /TAXON_ID=37353 /ORGANISM="Rosalina sp." /LENGTH=274 /DNA_ID=CAMNT_0047983939 /DNA_START=794 /DNA_END=1618 /DNA_ORIENTATION=+
MPKFKAPINLNTNHGVVANDIIYKEEQQQQQGHYDEKTESFMIPSEVLNARYGDIDDVPFDYGDDIKPPSVNKHVIAKKETVMTTEKAKVKVKESVNIEQVHHYPTPKDDYKRDEEEEKRAEIKTVQPFIPDVKPQNDSLQNKKVESSKGGFDANALLKGKQALKRREEKKKEEDKEEDKEKDNAGIKPKVDPSSGGKFVFDASALQKARERLNKHEKVGGGNDKSNGDESKKGDSENENVKGVKETIFDAMKKRRVFIESDDEDDDDGGSFSD